jgi:hypothetical protein
MLSIVNTQTNFFIFFAVTGVFCLFSWLLFFFGFELIEESDPTGEKRAERDNSRRDELSQHGDDKVSNEN